MYPKKKNLRALADMKVGYTKTLTLSRKAGKTKVKIITAETTEVHPQVTNCLMQFHPRDDFIGKFA